MRCIFSVFMAAFLCHLAFSSKCSLDFVFLGRLSRPSEGLVCTCVVPGTQDPSNASCYPSVVSCLLCQHLPSCRNSRGFSIAEWGEAHPRRWPGLRSPWSATCSPAAVGGQRTNGEPAQRGRGGKRLKATPSKDHRESGVWRSGSLDISGPLWAAGRVVPIPTAGTCPVLWPCTQQELPPPTEQPGEPVCCHDTPHPVPGTLSQGPRLELFLPRSGSASAGEPSLLSESTAQIMVLCLQRWVGSGQLWLAASQVGARAHL